MCNSSLWRILLVALLFTIQGCDSARSRIVGQWKVVGEANNVVWDFAKDGSVAVDGRPGRYSFGDGDRIKIQTPAATFVHQLEFADDRMIWKGQDGTKIELTRVK